LSIAGVRSTFGRTLQLESLVLEHRPPSISTPKFGKNDSTQRSSRKVQKVTQTRSVQISAIGKVNAFLADASGNSPVRLQGPATARFAAPVDLSIFATKI
ncbi:MAG TPA: hypothetical protein VK638_32315, partial [Edaphobacter sp.]|nr:hypothetical protein [Edaphobacter sp.]